MKYLSMLLIMLCSTLPVFAQHAEIRGKVTDKDGEPIIGAVVQVEQNGKQISGATTNYDGFYSITGLMVGRYSLIAQYAGMNKVTITKISVPCDSCISYQNIKMVESTNELREFVICYKIPLVETARPRTNKRLVAENIEHMATRNVNDIAAGQQHSGNSVNIGGARSQGTLYVIDGVMVNGHTNVKADRSPNTESYDKKEENDFKSVQLNPLSTMSVDVDRASYSNIRRYINEGQRPPEDAVRIEEMVNYFNYQYPQPAGKDPVAIATELSECPWEAKHKLLRIGIQARKVDVDKLPPSNMVFLIDVSGSMSSENKLPLVKASLLLLTDHLRQQDKIAIVEYAGNAGLALPPTNNKALIREALNRLEAGGSTAGGAGIQLAYNTAEEQFIKGGNNRVILATDGDFNVGITGNNDLEALIVKEREKGIFLTCLGYGMGNYKDNKMELLADKGNGNYAYTDELAEAQKTLIHEFGGTLFTLAKDVKAQIEFNPAKVQGYRLVGYENRLLNEEDFKNDKKDAGDMGSGHSVTILYELIPAGIKTDYLPKKERLKYQATRPGKDSSSTADLATVKFRYKQPDGEKSSEIVQVIADNTEQMAASSPDTRFAASVAMFGMLLKKSHYKGNTNYDRILELAKGSAGTDAEGYRKEFIALVLASR